MKLSVNDLNGLTAPRVYRPRGNFSLKTQSQDVKQGRQQILQLKFFLIASFLCTLASNIFKYLKPPIQTHCALICDYLIYL